MKEDFQWTKETYERSISSRCWTYTPYGEGWNNCPEMDHDDELREIVKTEELLGPVPEWAQEIVERSINFPPFCPHHAFPQPYLEVVDAIGRQAAPSFVHGCYTADRARKKRMLDYLFCLDAWRAGADNKKAADELDRRGNDAVDWHRVCGDLWHVLGEHTALKDLLVDRVLHRQRWWVKSLVWDDDSRDVYGQDQYLGNIRCQGFQYGNRAFSDPYFTELEVSRVKRMEERLSEICPDWEWFRSIIHDSWLCAPKAFRFLERLLYSIGKERRCVALPSHPLESGDAVPGFLQCEDTYPDRDDAARWVRAFVSGLRSWVGNRPAVEEVDIDVHNRLGEQTALKLWLVRLFLRKFAFLNPYDAVAAMPNQS